jgi:hypothetical protein
MLFLKPCLFPLHLINLSPFVINGKGIFPSEAAPPDRLSSYGASSCTSKTYKISIQKEFIFGVEITPSLWRRYSKASRGSGFEETYGFGSGFVSVISIGFLTTTLSCFWN